MIQIDIGSYHANNSYKPKIQVVPQMSYPKKVPQYPMIDLKSFNTSKMLLRQFNLYEIVFFKKTIFLLLINF